ncbi:TPA: hypothetical protein SMM93_003996 [Proteus mirabilis]
MLYIKPFFIYFTLLLLGFLLIVYFFFDIGVFNALSIKDLIIPGVALVVSIISLIVNGDLNKKSSFNNKFSLLLEQHNKYHDELTNNLGNKDQEEKKEGKRKLLFCYDYHTPNDYLYGNAEFSPYMRVLYHILKNIDGEFKNSYSEAKKNTSLVRSLIRNDILYYIAINSLSDKNTSFQNYRYLLKKYDFFEHLKFDDEKYLNTDDIKLERIDESLNVIKRFLRSILNGVMVNHFFDKNNFIFEMNEDYSKIEEFLEISIPTLLKYKFHYDNENYLTLKKELESYIINLLKKTNIYCECKYKYFHDDVSMYNNISIYKYYIVGLIYSDFKGNDRRMKHLILDPNLKNGFNGRIYYSFKKINFDDCFKTVLTKKLSFNCFKKHIIGKRSFNERFIMVADREYKLSKLKRLDNIENKIGLDEFYNKIIKLESIGIIRSEVRKKEFYSKIQDEYLSVLNSLNFFEEQDGILSSIKTKLNK